MAAAPESYKALLNQMDKWAAMQGQSVYGTNSQEQSWNINQGQFSDSSDIVCKLHRVEIDWDKASSSCSSK